MIEFNGVLDSTGSLIGMQRPPPAPLLPRHLPLRIPVSTSIIHQFLEGGKRAPGSIANAMFALLDAPTGDLSNFLTKY
jgi:hypothetical protein